MTREDRPHRVSRGGDRRRNSLPRGSRLSVSRASRPARRAAARARWTQGAHQAVVAGTIAFMPCGLVSRDRVGEEPLVAIPVRRPRRAQVLSRTGPRATDGASASPHAQSSRPARTLAVEAAACGLKQRRCSSVRPHASPRSLLFLVRPARHDCLGDDRMVGSAGSPAVSDRRRESRDWRLRRPLHVPLPHPRTRRPRHDAPLRDHARRAHAIRELRRDARHARQRMWHAAAAMRVLGNSGWAATAQKPSSPHSKRPTGLEPALCSRRPNSAPVDACCAYPSS